MHLAAALSEFLHQGESGVHVADQRYVEDGDHGPLHVVGPIQLRNRRHECELQKAGACKTCRLEPEHAQVQVLLGIGESSLNLPALLNPCQVPERLNLCSSMGTLKYIRSNATSWCDPEVADRFVPVVRTLTLSHLLMLFCRALSHLHVCRDTILQSSMHSSCT